MQETNVSFSDLQFDGVRIGELDYNGDVSRFRFCYIRLQSCNLNCQLVKTGFATCFKRQGRHYFDEGSIVKRNRVTIAIKTNQDMIFDFSNLYKQVCINRIVENSTTFTC